MATENDGNIFTRKLGPLPGWAWVGIGVAVAVVFVSRKKSGSSGTSANGLQAGAVSYQPQIGYSPQQPYSYEQSASDMALAGLVGAIVQQLNSPGAVSPGNPAAPATTPGSTGNPAIQPQINSADFPVVGTPGSSYVPLGRITGSGGQYEGQNVGQGAPVYAYTGGQYLQDFNVSTLPVGTELYTPSQFTANIVPGTVQEKLGA